MFLEQEAQGQRTAVGYVRGSTDMQAAARASWILRFAFEMITLPIDER